MGPARQAQPFTSQTESVTSQHALQEQVCILGSPREALNRLSSSVDDPCYRMLLL